jgi:hypothetical protein
MINIFNINCSNSKQTTGRERGKNYVYITQTLEDSFLSKIPNILTKKKNFIPDFCYVWMN